MNNSTACIFRHLSSGEICIELQKYIDAKIVKWFCKVFFSFKAYDRCKVSFFWTIKIIMFYGAAVGTSAAYG